MKTSLIVIGKTANKHLAALISDYSERIIHYMPFEIVYLPETKRSKSTTEDMQREHESELILSKISTGDFLVLLDERGKQMSSLALSEWLNKKKQLGRKLAFVVGGPYGFSQSVYKRADEMISLSAMTFSHDMARLLLCEQIYRASTILRGESYHHQ